MRTISEKGDKKSKEKPKISKVLTKKLTKKDKAITPYAPNDPDEGNPKKKRNRNALLAAGCRTDEMIEVDVEFSLPYFIKGYTFTMIAEKLNAHNAEIGRVDIVTSNSIRQDLNKRLRILQKHNLETMKSYMQLEMLKLDNIEREMWEAWEKSKQGREQRVTQFEKDQIKRVMKNLGQCIERRKAIDGQEMKVIWENNCGDVMYMRVILEVMKRRAKLIGYDNSLNIQMWTEKDSPDKSDQAISQSKDSGTVPIQIVNNRYSIDDMTEDALIELSRSMIKPI